MEEIQDQLVDADSDQQKENPTDQIQQIEQALVDLSWSSSKELEEEISEIEEQLEGEINDELREEFEDELDELEEQKEEMEEDWSNIYFWTDFNLPRVTFLAPVATPV